MKANIKSFIAIAVIALTLNNNAFAQKESKSESAKDVKAEATKSAHKIVFQLTTADTMAHKALMKQISNIKSVSPDIKIEVVCHGPGLDILVNTKTIVHEKIKSAKEKGVEFIACEFSMKERKVEKSAIITEADFVPAGIIEIVIKQEEGWAYIKAGF